MNSPYMGKFQVTQEFKGQSHDGLDLVGLDSKEIHSTVNGTVHYAGWENSANHSQGFGKFVCIRGTDDNFYYFGHLSEIRVKVGDTVRITDVLGVEGNTGYSTGSHCHYCVRPQFTSGNALNVSEISGIPNTLGVYDDGYTSTSKNSVNVTLSADGRTYSGTLNKN
ncbi:MAG: M23 family metallopeptidase [Prevotella sp.]|nr:M23 family metallopeptidase [Alistipes senegalensis]MCM1357031.1 M23 family metallopeptidase [Prevotella sp.]MCM1473227.1 M23 family metallopeptidase [Muribaculaceae bacterium]